MRPSRASRATAPDRRRTDQQIGVLELVCVVIVVVAIVALVVWIVTTAGGGVLNQG